MHPQGEWQPNMFSFHISLNETELDALAARYGKDSSSFMNYAFGVNYVTNFKAISLLWLPRAGS